MLIVAALLWQQGDIYFLRRKNAQIGAINIASQNKVRMNVTRQPHSSTVLKSVLTKLVDKQLCLEQV